MDKHEWLKNDYERFLSSKLITILITMHEENLPESENIIREIGKINYASNVNSVMWFYFPIVSHVLYFMPNLADRLLHYIIEPIFANGDRNPSSVVAMLKSTLQHKESTIGNYMSIFGRSYVFGLCELDFDVIEQALNYCWLQLDDKEYYEQATDRKWSELRTNYIG